MSDQHSFPLESVFEFLRVATVEDVLTQALLTAPMFAARWRWNAYASAGRAAISRAAVRFRRRSNACARTTLLAAVFPDQAACAENLAGPIRIPDHPLVNETIDNCLHEAMDLDGLKESCEASHRGRFARSRSTRPSRRLLSRDPEREPLRVSRRCSARGAPRARGAVAQRSENRRLRWRGILDPAAIDQISAEVWPDPRDADELHDAMLTLVVVPAEPDWQGGSRNYVLRTVRVVMQRGGRAVLVCRGTGRMRRTMSSRSCAGGWNVPVLLRRSH